MRRRPVGTQLPPRPRGRVLAPEDRDYSGVRGILEALVEVFHLGEDLMVERIADILSSKYLGATATKLREMAHTPPPKPFVLERLTTLLQPGRFKRLFG